MNFNEKVLLIQLEQNSLNATHTQQEVMEELTGRIMVGGLLRIFSHISFVITIGILIYCAIRGFNGWPIYVGLFFIVATVLLYLKFIKVIKNAMISMVSIKLCAKVNEMIFGLDTTLVGALRKNLALNIMAYFNMSVRDAAEYTILFEQAKDIGNLDIKSLKKFRSNLDNKSEEIYKEIQEYTKGL